MLKRSFFGGLALSLFLVLQPDRAAAVATLSLGTRITIDANTFALPILITDGVQVTDWTVGLDYDPTDVQINTACDPFSGDIYCSLIGPFTEGDFFASGAPFNLLTEGVVELDPITFQQTGVMFGFHGAYQGFPPALPLKYEGEE